jgi:hypothetical protein
MTLIITRTSCRFALMVTDRKVTKSGSLVDPDANKNLIFEDRNAVVAMGYTGMAYIGGIPTDQWLAQTLTGLAFPEGRRGPNTVPALMISQYATEYFGVRVRNLRQRLNEVCKSIRQRYRKQWTANSFDLFITGWEWNRGKSRPYLAGLSKPAKSDDFELCTIDRNWYLPQRGRVLVRTCAAPKENLTQDKLAGIETQLQAVWSNNHGSSSDIADHAEKLMVETIQLTSQSLSVVGEDVMSILIPPPQGPSPTIRIRYIPAGRDTGVLVTANKQIPVPVAFSPWVISPGCIRSPTIFTNMTVESVCGPYRVIMISPGSHGIPRVLSSQERVPE